MTSLLFEKVSQNALLPQKTYPEDAGFDLFAHFTTETTAMRLKPGQRVAIGTGIKANIPAGCYGQILPRSGLAIRNGIDVLGGVIDSGFKNELKVILINLDFHTLQVFEIRHAMRIAQLVILPLARLPSPVCSEKTRGSAGFGSSGLY